MSGRNDNLYYPVFAKGHGKSFKTRISSLKNSYIEKLSHSRNKIMTLVKEPGDPVNSNACFRLPLV